MRRLPNLTRFAGLVCFPHDSDGNHGTSLVCVLSCYGTMGVARKALAPSSAIAGGQGGFASFVRLVVWACGSDYSVVPASRRFSWAGSVRSVWCRRRQTKELPPWLRRKCALADTARPLLSL